LIVLTDGQRRCLLTLLCLALLVGTFGWNAIGQSLKMGAHPSVVVRPFSCSEALGGMKNQTVTQKEPIQRLLKTSPQVSTIVGWFDGATQLNDKRVEHRF
jgi:hypothetical protein